MEVTRLEQDIEVICITVENFPEEIISTHEKLHELVPYQVGREYYAISWRNANGMIYKAASNILHENERNLGLETYTIKQGAYIREIIPNYRNHIPRIKSAFETLLQDPRLDSEGFCLEAKMTEKDLWCMVKIKD
jgi:hypothetical protein